MRVNSGYLPVLVGELFERFEDLIFANIAPGTVRGYMTAWRNRVAPSFAHRDIRSITALDIELAMVSWSGTPSTKLDALYMFSRLCKVALKGGLIASNPCLGVDRPRIIDNDVSSRSLSVDELSRLLDFIRGKGVYERFIKALLFTGCRLGEIAGLYVSDVDLEARVINIRRTRSAGMNGEMVTGPTKGRKHRSVPIAEPLVEVIEEAMQGKEEHDYLFSGVNRGTLSSQNLSRALRWSQVRDSIKKFPPGEHPLRFHDLRHTAAVVLFQAGVSPPDVQAILGHSSLLVTQQYADTRHDAAQRGSAALSIFYGAKIEHSPNEGVR